MTAKLIAASRFRVTPTTKPDDIAQRLTDAFAKLDDGEGIALKKGGVYRLGDAPILCARGETALVGDVGTRIQHRSRNTKTWGEGSGVLVGLQPPNNFTVGTTQPKNVIVRSLEIEDLNDDRITEDWGKGWYWSSGINLAWMDGFVHDDITYINSKGNACFTALGMAQSDDNALSERITVTRSRARTERGGFVQGDLFNIGGFRNITVTDSELRFGGIERHFYEGGTGNLYSYLARNFINLNNEGYGCAFGSMTSFGTLELEDNNILNWSNLGAGISVAPDVDPTGQRVMPVRNLIARRNLFSSPAGIAAVSINVAEAPGHVYEGNHFDCMLPFFIAKPIDGAVPIIRGNTTSERVGARKIAAAPGVVVDSDWPVN